MTLAWKYCLTGWLDKGADKVPLIWQKHSDKLNYIAGQIEETKEERSHVQFWVEFKKRLRPYGVKKIFPSAQYHHERIRGTDIENDAYVKKDDSRKPGPENGPWFFGETKHSRNASKKEILEIRDKVIDGCSERELWLDHYAIMSVRQRSIRRSIEVLQTEPIIKKFELDDFKWAPITDWSTTHVFAGDSDIGKTSFAIAHFQNPFFCTDLDNIKFFNKSIHDGIIFDDLLQSFSMLTDDVLIHFVDIDHPRQIKCRFHNGTIPANTHKIITTNKDATLVFNEVPAIARRTTIHQLRGKQTTSDIPPASQDSGPDMDNDRRRSRSPQRGDMPDPEQRQFPRLSVIPEGEEEWEPMSTMNPPKRAKFPDMSEWNLRMEQDDDEDGFNNDWTDTEEDEE